MSFIKYILMSTISFILLTCANTENQFLRELPSRHLLQDVNSERFPNDDAIIILNETSFKVEPSTTIIQGTEYSGISTTHTNVKVVSILTESGVEKYGSYEFEYGESYRNVLNAFTAKVRILKPDGSIELMPLENIQRVNALVDDDDHVLRRKVLFKIPNLAVNDVLQIETVFTRPFTYSTGRLFYLNEEDASIITNLYITLPRTFEVNISEYPEDRIPDPQVQQISDKFGAGETHFWSLSNTGKIYTEPYSQPIIDRSALILFNVESFGDPTYELDWDQLSENFYDDYHNEFHISKSNYDDLGLTRYKHSKSLEWGDMDSIYTQIRSIFISDFQSSLYPQYASLRSLLKASHASASDMAMLMYTILAAGGENVRFALIRDEREGQFKSEINSFFWFDRIGVVAIKGDEKRLYDFDASIPHIYEFPWFLEKANVLTIEKDINAFVMLERWGENGSIHTSHESQLLEIDTKKNKAHSEFGLDLAGIFGNEFRFEQRNETPTSVESFLQKDLKEHVFEEVDVINLNPYLAEGDIKINAEGTPDIDAIYEEDFISIGVKNYHFRKFLDELRTVKRHNNLDFSRPRTFEVNYSIPIPEGYSFKEDRQPQQTNYGLSLSARTNSEVIESTLKLSSTIEIKRSLIPVNQFEKFYSTLLQALEKIEQPVVFEKMH